jgi:hypothetical protein
MITSFEFEELSAPHELKAWVHSQVANGRYATGTDVIVEALQVLVEELRVSGNTTTEHPGATTPFTRARNRSE